MSKGISVSWDEVVRDLAAPVAASRIEPDTTRHTMYRELMTVYAACEAHALGRGPDPVPEIERFRHSFLLRR
jgi:hypothetical protein